MSFIKHVLYKYFFQSVFFSFYFLNSVFEEDKFLILMKPNYLYFPLTDHAFGVVSRKFLLNSRPLIFREET